MRLKRLNIFEFSAVGLTILVSLTTLPTYAQKTPQPQSGQEKQITLTPPKAVSPRDRISEIVDNSSAVKSSLPERLKLNQKSSAGGFNGGGGDPLANDFLKKAELLARAVAFNLIPGLKGNTSTEDSSGTLIEVDKISKITAAIRNSLDDQNPLLVFPTGVSVNCFGEPKVGCVDNDRIIRVARDGYLALAPSRQFEVVALEYFKLMNLNNRYELAQYVEYYMRGKDEKIYTSHKNDLDTLVYQIDRLIGFGNRFIKSFGNEKVLSGDKLASSCFQLAQLYSGILAYQNLATDFIRNLHGHESNFQITNKEYGILGNLYQTASSDVGIPGYCGSNVSLTLNSVMTTDSHIQKGQLRDLIERVLKPTLNQLNQIKSNLLNY